MEQKINPKFFHLFLMVLILFVFLFSQTTESIKAAVSSQELEPKVEPDLTMQLTADQTSGYLIYFKAQPDLSAAYSMDWQTRGRYVVSQLQETASRSQARVREYLDARKTPYVAYWIDNIIVVDQSDQITFNGLLKFPEIEILRTRRQQLLAEPDLLSASPNAVEAVETNISRIGAVKVWDMGVNGNGIVVANIDTGVRYTHQALVNQYRGNLGGGNFNHNYNWWDPALGDQNLVPDDWHGHGSHTMGIMLGNDGSENQIGMAPGATWITCQAFEFDDNELLECGQFLAAPWDLNQQNPNPDMRPHIINNSWGDCLQVFDPWYDSVINHWHALGIYPVFSNGNAGNCNYSSPPGLNTVGNPARTGDVTAVGSTNRDDGTYAVHSNWGPTDDLDTINPHGFPDLKPQVVAPGYNIRSSTNDSDTQYENWAGTSMAAPHVSGLVALMWSAAPCLIGDYAATETILEETANPIYYDDGSPATPSNYPNYATGWGEIDAYQAVLAAVDFCGNYLISAEPTSQAVCTPSDDVALYELTITQLRGSASPVTLITQGQPVGSFVEFSVNPVIPSATSTLTISNLGPAVLGAYEIGVLGVSVTETHTITVGLNLYSERPSQVNLLSPADGAVDQDSTPNFSWNSVAQTESYWIEIATDDSFSNLIESRSVKAETYSPLTNLVPGTVYYWRVKAMNACGDGEVSPIWHFATAPLPGECNIGIDPNILYRTDFENGALGWTSSGIANTWNITTTRAYSSSYAYHAQNLSEVSDQRLVTPAIALPIGDDNDLTLQFWHWQEIEDGFSADVCFDGGILEISTDGGSTWTQLQDDVLQTTPYDGIVSSGFDNPLAGKYAWCGGLQDWLQSVVDLDAFSGQTVQFRFRLGTDSSYGKEGWYLDNVHVQSCGSDKSPWYLPIIVR